MRVVALVTFFGSILVAPSVAGGWMVQGEYEPNTPYDWSHYYMFEDPDTSPRSNHRQIYFNGMLIHGSTGLNPNLAILAGNMVVPGLQYPFAYFGAWKDCNNDGYVGHAESALLEYRKELLLDTGICRPEGPSTEGNWYPTNDGEWIREFRWIGWSDNAANPQGRAAGVFNDVEALVWADVGVPGAAPTLTCPGIPPPGTFSSSGAILAFVDCYGRRGLLATMAGVRDPIGLGIDLEFENEEYPACSESTLQVQLNLFYDSAGCPHDGAGILEPGSGRSALTVWDCDQRVNVGLEGEAIISQPLPKAPTVDPSGSWYEGASHVLAGMEGGCSEAGGSRFDPTYASLLPEQPGPSAAVKRETTFAFEFHNDRSGSYSRRILDDPQRPPNLGVTALNGLGILTGVVGADRLGPGWQSQSMITEGATLLGPQIGHTADPSYYTFYARVGKRVFATAAQGPNLGWGSIYGAEQCGSNDSGIHNGMDCDADHWWNTEYGAREMPRATWSQHPLGARLGDIYHLRDVDCHDGSPSTPTGVTPSMFSGSVCPWPADHVSII